MKWLVFSAALFAFAAPVSAATVSYTWTAERDTIINAPAAGSTAEEILGFATISGTLTYNTDAADSLSDSSRGLYVTGILSLDQVDLGSPVPGSERTFILNDRAGTDVITFGTYFAGTRLNLRMHDSTATALADDSLPANLSFDDFDENLWVTISVSGTDSDPASVYSLTSFERITQVPLPAGLPLLGVGLLGLGWTAQRRKNPGRLG